MEHRQNFVAVGRLRTSDNTVHVGHNKWLPKIIYDDVMRSQKPTTCINSILVCIFGHEGLLKSTISGKSSNAAYKDGEIDKPNKLDPSLVKLCQEWFWHWLSIEYIGIDPEADILEEYNNFVDYA